MKMPLVMALNQQSKIENQQFLYAAGFVVLRFTIMKERPNMK